MNLCETRRDEPRPFERLSPALLGTIVTPQSAPPRKRQPFMAKKAQSQRDPLDTQFEPYGNLLLDSDNPRLAELKLNIADQDQILKWLWKNKVVDELVDSMLAGGYWPHEELFVSKEKGKLVVMEGNRRLAAVKLLMEPQTRRRLQIKADWKLSVKARTSLEKLPIIVRSRSDIWDYVGFKHLNGPQPWDSIAKAQYIHRVHTEFKIPLEKIATTLGDRNDTVLRMYRGYLVLKQAMDKGLFDPEDRVKPKLAFSHLWTALGYTSVLNFLGVTPARLGRPNPVAQKNLKNLGELLLWLYGSKEREIEPKVRSQNPHLREMTEVLKSRRGLQFLRSGQPLAVALEAATGDERLFQDALSRAESELRTASRFVATGYLGNTDLLETATNVEKIGRMLVKTMKNFAPDEDREP